MTDFIIKKLPYDLTSNAGLDEAATRSGLPPQSRNELLFNVTPSILLR